MTVTSMADERTNRTLTWFNSPLRGNQKIETLFDMIQVGQWYGKHTRNAQGKKPHHPVVKSRNIDPSLFQSVQEKHMRTGNGDDSDSGSDEEEELPPSPVLQLESRDLDTSFVIDHDVNINSKALLDLRESPDGDGNDSASDDLESISEVRNTPKDVEGDIDWDSGY
ncbi:hypothetical protein C8J57DRAFT_1242945 [Mycena rebaudengoi]|nr:hypothetical protein C8J57DRAFT_1242945 [Mycena rebaudengoi]